ncbi:MAG: Uma2 family endonuclease [Oscillatoriales cyanobacterium SM2_1_8]|nr:Uma2 family endonuclease [Oscillatoriales cyanobacterium SM2_1_8]
MTYLQGPLPTAADLPDSDETPVDNQLQDDLPQLLKEILRRIWAERNDWFFAVDMGLYYHPHQPAIVPDALLSVGVPHLKEENGRLSYVVWEEGKFPDLVLEVVSQNYNGEYEEKLHQYQELGILYYAVCNPLVGRGRRHRDREFLEVYELGDGVYRRRAGHPIWLPTLGLGLGYAERAVGRWQRRWLYWYDEQGERYPTDSELRLQEQWQRLLAEKQTQRETQQRLLAEEQAQQAISELARLRDRLRDLGFDPDR